MKLKKQNIFLIVCYLLILALAGGSAYAQTPQKILILPFQIHAEKDLSFLKKGIADMLASRLAQEGKLVLISPAEAVQYGPEPANARQALALGEKMKVDYVVFGSLTLFGESISTDARLIDVPQKKPLVTFNRFGKSHDEAISHVNQFAQKINTQVFGRKVAAAPPPVQKEVVDQSRRHPEAVYKESGGMGSEYSYEVPGELKRKDFTIWRSRNFPMHIRGLAIGDVDGDGKNEAVFISEETLMVFRYVAGRFQKVAEIKGEFDTPFIGVDVADINANGKAEIFVSAITALDINDQNPIQSLRSFVLEWSGKEFVKIVDQQNWYFRIIRVPPSGPLLLGQKRGFTGIFSGGVYLMTWQNGKYEPAQRQKLPKDANVFSFNYGDVMNNGQEMIVAFTPEEYLRILGKDMDQQWKSSKSMGGSGVYLEYVMDGQSDSSSPLAGVPEMDNFYIPQRILVADMEGDGKNEVIVVNNRDRQEVEVGNFARHFFLIVADFHGDQVAFHEIGQSCFRLADASH